MPVTVAEPGNGGQARVGDAARASSDSDPAMILPAGAAGVDHHHYLPLPTFLGPPITPPPPLPFYFNPLLQAKWPIRIR